MTALSVKRVMIETVRTRDITVHFPDGSTETRRARPPGDGWRILRDRERHTIWTRRTPVVRPTVREPSVAAMTAAELARVMPDVARHFWGEPNPHHSNGKELRWGTNGARCVDLAKGTWFDHEANEGGGVIDLLKREDVARSVAMAARKWVCRTP